MKKYFDISSRNISDFIVVFENQGFFARMPVHEETANCGPLPARSSAARRFPFVHLLSLRVLLLEPHVQMPQEKEKLRTSEQDMAATLILTLRLHVCRQQFKYQSAEIVEVVLPKVGGLSCEYPILEMLPPGKMLQR